MATDGLHRRRRRSYLRAVLDAPVPEYGLDENIYLTIY